MEICSYNKCTGCFACANACNKGCITLEEDKYGEIHPVVDEKKCIHCGLCKKVCPNNLKLDLNYPRHCYASWIDDEDKRKICASGGIGTIMSEFVLRYKQGVVFGTAYDSTFTPIATFTEKLEGLEKFKGSKYTQSIVGCSTFKQIKEFLMQGRFVIYIATPCQIAGLKSYLRKDYDKLITVDLICHGVSPTKYFKEELAYICKQHKIPMEKVSDVRFRGNDKNNFKFSIWNLDSTGISKCLYSASYRKNYYLAGFLQGVSLRENCYTCNYAHPERISYITIGDFIWLGKTIPYQGKTRNVSSVTVNTPKGEIFYNEVSAMMPELINVERDYIERLAYKPSLCEPSARHQGNSKFKKLYLQEGYVSAIRKTLYFNLVHSRFKYLFRYARIKFNSIFK